MTNIVELYDPHQDATAVPQNIYRLAHSLKGKIMDLDDALRQIRFEAGKLGGVARADNHGYIWFMYRSDGLKHGFRLINYRNCK